MYQYHPTSPNPSVLHMPILVIQSNNITQSTNRPHSILTHFTYNLCICSCCNAAPASITITASVASQTSESMFNDKSLHLSQTNIRKTVNAIFRISTIEVALPKLLSLLWVLTDVIDA